MNIQNILCPTDLSKLSAVANQHASSLASRYGAKLHYMYAYEPVFADGYLDAAGPPPPPADLEGLRRQLEDIKPTCDDVETACELLVGFPATSIVGYANTHAIDLIVLGTHGRTGVSRFLLGSVAEAVSRTAGCPVLMVHETNVEALTP